jgi:hypothetical protein
LSRFDDHAAGDRKIDVLAQQLQGTFRDLSRTESQIDLGDNTGRPGVEHASEGFVPAVEGIWG